MHYFLIIGAFLWFAFLAPPMVTAATVGSFFLVALVGARTVQAVTGAQVGMGDVLRSVGLAFVFAGIAMLGLGSLLAKANMAVPLLAILAAYVLGFSVGLDIEFVPACIVAVVTTVVSAILIVLVKTIL
jgi:hypothetical protein